MEETISFWKVSLHWCKLDLETKLSYINNHFLENDKCLRWLIRPKFRFISSFKFNEQICKLNSHKHSLFGEQQMSWMINNIIIQTTSTDKIFEKISSYPVKYRTTGKVQILFSRSLLLVLTKLSFWEEDWALGYTSMKFWHYFELS